MLITDPKANAHNAARIFAESYWDDEPRTVGKVVDIPRTGPNSGGIDFQFVGGVRWYSVRMKFDHSGWLVALTNPPV